MKVNEVTPKLLYSFFRKLTKDRAYTRRTIANIRSVLNGIFSYAVERDIVSANPVRDVDLKRMTYKPEMSKSEEVFSFEEAQKLLAVLRNVDDDPYALAIRLDFNLFIRFGEIAGLKWENVDLENRLVYICHQITYEPEMNDDLSFTEKRMVTEGYLKGCTSQGYRSSHKIRFYAASTAYNVQNLAQLSKMMGHSQVSTTMHYLRDAGNKDDYTSLFSRLGTQTT